jgi:hypothetical protein
MPRISDRLHNAAEQIGDFTRGLFPYTWTAMSPIRGWNPNPLGLRFWPTSHPAAEGTQVNYDFARSLYRNDSSNNLGGAFAKPIVDLQVQFIGIPTASTDNDSTNVFLNDCLHIYWVDEIQQMVRDALRDSKVIVRIHKPDVLDPLMTLDEADHCNLECLPPERVDLEYDGNNKNIIARAVIRHRMWFVIDPGSPEKGLDPTVEEHDVIEIIDRERFRFFDQNTNKWIDSFGSDNKWGFVPLLEVYNEWDASLQSGQSDLETVIPFLNAFDAVLNQGLQAHTYHSTPKLMLKLADVMPFVRNNFPEILDENGRVMDNATISWKGREIFFFQTDEDASFIEAKSVLGDTQTLAEFLIDCICIASQTPEWAFMRVDSGSANSDRNAQTVPFVKKVDRKRRIYTKPIQQLMKMALVINDLIPIRAELSWDPVRVDDQVVEMQAFQQLVMGLEVARSRGEISDETYQRMIQQYLPVMRSPSQEKSQPDQLTQPNPQGRVEVPPVPSGNSNAG